VVDYSRQFVMPGLIDVHVHLAYGNAKSEADITLRFRCYNGCFPIGDDMRPTRRQILRLTGSLCALAAPTALLNAQAIGWPNKPIRIIVPGGPGGVTDIRARWLGERLGPALGQLIVVENRSGAGGNLGTAAVAHSAPDGYTLVIVHIGTMAINPHLYASLGYDPLTDLVPITRLGAGPQVLVVHRDVPAASVAELLSLARAKPDELSFVSPGIGTPGHLASSMLLYLTGTKATHIPYKGGGQAVVDLVAGHVTWTIEGLTVLKPFIQDGRLRPLAVTSAQRVKSMPDLPTMAEAGVPGYDFTAWAGLAAPAGTPDPIIKKLYGEIARILATPEAREWFESFGVEPGGEPPDVFAALVRTEYSKMGDVIRATGIKIE
jgi:tripartite-type tricarboxylate transporter receptor subunit TctC